jgi:hypothetical protein
MNDNRGHEPRLELTPFGFLSPLAFGSSFEELASFLIDHVVDAEPIHGLGRFWIPDLHGPMATRNRFRRTAASRTEVARSKGRNRGCMSAHGCACAASTPPYLKGGA